MASGSSREAIRDDRYYTSLLLGRRASPSPSSPSVATAPSIYGAVQSAFAQQHKPSLNGPMPALWPQPTAPSAPGVDASGSAHTLLSLKGQTELCKPSEKNGEPCKRKRKELMVDAEEHTGSRLSESDTPEEGDRKRKHPTKRKFRKATHTVRKKAIACKVLREAVQGQQLEFANIQGIMSEYALCQARRETLWALKPTKLAEARQFLLQRRPNVDPCKPMCEDHRYELANGDFCSTRFTTIQFHGVESVKQVFDLLLFYFCNIEISISEKLGHITIREDDDSGDKGVTQNRLVSTTINGLLMESNTVLFSHFYEPNAESGHGRGRGLIVADYVDEDDRHPYRPTERIRRDINAILELTSYTRKVPTLGDDLGAKKEEEEVVVVLTRWIYSKLHRPKCPIPSGIWEELRDNMDRWGETMHRTMVESLTPVG
ncbi:hypothetical protein BBJ28_00001759 [Nothophytophthora sp. Chile5]|nr:hypothetical protein BBJ28_00001759 [Nothophytophthora sp. Chile5]